MKRASSNGGLFCWISVALLRSFQERTPVKQFCNSIYDKQQKNYSTILVDIC